VYAKQVLWEAVSWLATSPDSIQERLANAGVSLTKLSTENDGGLPQEQLDEFQSILRALRGEPDGKETSIAANTGKLSDENCTKLAERILAIYVDITGGL
jgi:hypothetical protein